MCHVSSDLQRVGVIARWARGRGGRGNTECAQRREFDFGGTISRLIPNPAGDFDKLLAPRPHLWSGGRPLSHQSFPGNLRSPWGSPFAIKPSLQ